MTNLVDLYCVVDDFCQLMLPELKKAALPELSKKKLKLGCLSEAEIMMVLIHFHQSHSGFLWKLVEFPGKQSRVRLHVIHIH